MKTMLLVVGVVVFMSVAMAQAAVGSPAKPAERPSAQPSVKSLARPLVQPKPSVIVQDPPEVPELKLSIQSTDMTYKIGQKVSFELAISNVGQVPIKVMKLDETSTFCDINGKRWGSTEPSAAAVVIMFPGDSLRKKFKVSGVDKPGDFKVSCSYGMGVSGVRPSAEVVLKIVR